jgi:hypothetical protein
MSFFCLECDFEVAFLDFFAEGFAPGVRVCRRFVEDLGEGDGWVRRALRAAMALSIERSRGLQRSARLTLVYTLFDFAVFPLESLYFLSISAHTPFSLFPYLDTNRQRLTSLSPNGIPFPASATSSGHLRLA